MKLPILIYHRIVTEDQYKKLESEQELIYSITVSGFENQIRYLHDKGFKSLRLEEATQCIIGMNSVPGRVVAITFDDGVNSQYELACAILRKWGFTATFFVTTDKNCLEFHSEEYQDPPLTDAQIRQMDSWGFGIGSHTHTHANLEDMSGEQIHYELTKSKRILEKILAKEVVYLSVPGGHYKKEVVEVAKLVGYKGICLSRGRVGEDHKDAFAIRRLGIKGYYSIDVFDRLIFGYKTAILKNRIELASKYLLKNTIGIKKYTKLRNSLIRLKSWQRS